MIVIHCYTMIVIHCSTMNNNNETNEKIDK